MSANRHSRNERHAGYDQRRRGGAPAALCRALMLGNWFQLAYNAVDSIIAGRFIGKDALAAEGIAGPVMNLVILGITGVCLGPGC